MVSDRFVFFGDSLTDGGAIFALTSELLSVPIPVESAGYAGVFSDGAVYAQTLPSLLGVDVENYGVGAARANGTQQLGDLFGRNGVDGLLLPDADLSLLDFEMNLGAQVGRFIAAETAAPYEGTTTASFLIGLNDISSFRPSGTADPVVEATELVTEIVTNTVGAGQALAQQGLAQSLLFYTFPDSSFFPFARLLPPDLAPFGDLLIEGHAQAIEAGAAQLQAAGVQAQVIDLGDISAEIAADPGSFGFQTVARQKWLGAASDPTVVERNGEVSLTFVENLLVADLDPDQIAFFDFLHPTSALHGVWAAFSDAALTRETREFTETVDRFNGDSSDEFALGQAGDDAIRLRGGDDIAFGGLGDDRIFADGGDDIVSGGSGDDRLQGHGGSDVVAGGAGDDILRGGGGDDVMIGGLGADIAHGGVGDDVFLYTDPALIGGETGADRDLIYGGLGEDTLYLAVSEQISDDVAAAIAANDGGFVQHFDVLDLTLVGVESVELVEDRQALTDLELEGAQAQ
ncbi:MAG: hypothetical protein KTR21_11205 [Rhodobacteraceae bacterium]|nr:hypothetical protein [Paracoccaceae bacterium]